MKKYHFTKLFTKGAISPLALCLLLSALFTFAYNYAMIHRTFQIALDLPVIDYDFVISLVALPMTVFFFVFSLLCWPKIEKPIFTFLILMACFFSYAQIYYGTVFDKEMIRNLFETDQQEATAYFSLNLIIWLAIFGALPVWLLWRIKIKYLPIKKQLIQKLKILVSCFAVIGIIAVFNFDDYATSIRNNVELRSMPVPFYALKSTYKYVRKTYIDKPLAYIKQGEDAKQTAREGKRNLVVLIVGETQRAKSYQLYGHTKPTNEYTKQQGVFPFLNTSSCGTATAQSLPCMFSNLSRKDFNTEKATARDNVLDILKRAGINVIWLENDGGCKGVCDKIYNLDIRKKYIATGKHAKYCPGKYCYDDVFLPELEDLLPELPENQDTLLVLHVMGSHGPAYYERYPLSFQEFMPDCDRSDVQNCTDAELENEYDNTIRYFDYVMSKMIASVAKVDKLNTSLFFISDHGESLGENGIYLHGLPYAIAPDEQTKVPLIGWMPDDFNASNKIDINCVKKNAATGPFSHENLFDTLLGLFNVKTSVYRPEMDMLGACRGK